MGMDPPRILRLFSEPVRGFEVDGFGGDRQLEFGGGSWLDYLRITTKVGREAS
jgi:hypothetical protein